jgi:hypothetical protein
MRVRVTGDEKSLKFLSQSSLLARQSEVVFRDLCTCVRYHYGSLVLFLAYADYVNILGGCIHILKKNAEALVAAT